MELGMPYTLWFDKAGKEAIGLVGGKNASLGELIKADIPVPPGFSVTTETYLELLSAGGMKEKIEEVLSRIDLEQVLQGSRIHFSGYKEAMRFWKKLNYACRAFLRHGQFLTG